jgi:hypothetical protein
MLGYSPDSIKRLANLWKVLVASEPPVGLPQKTESGLWMIPGSMVYFPMHGLRRYIPVRARTSCAIKGLNAAVRQKRIFHLWFHPTNLAEETERMFAGLRRIFDYASMLRVRGALGVFSMGSLLKASGMPAFGSAVGDEPGHRPRSSCFQP